MEKLFHQHIEREKWRKVSFFSSILVASYREHCEWRHKFFFLNNPSTLVCVHTSFRQRSTTIFTRKMLFARILCHHIQFSLCRFFIHSLALSIFRQNNLSVFRMFSILHSITVTASAATDNDNDDAVTEASIILIRSFVDDIFA